MTLIHRIGLRFLLTFCLAICLASLGCVTTASANVAASDTSIVGQVLTTLSGIVAVFSFFLKYNTQQNKNFNALREEVSKMHNEQMEMRRDIKGLWYHIGRTESASGEFQGMNTEKNTNV